MKSFCIAILLLALILVSACNRKKYFSGPNYYADGFENYHYPEELRIPIDVHWSYTQQTRSGNEISIDTSVVHSGKQSIKFVAKKSDADGASKCSIAKQHMAFWEGEILHSSAWYFISGYASADWLFIMDLEEQTAIGAGPGMRLALVGDSGYLRVEHKYNNPDLQQKKGMERAFPRNQWVHIEWEIKLHQKKKGYIKVWQNGQLIIEQYHWKTLPKDILYFQQGTKAMYSSLEIGITANTRDNNMELYVDDVSVEKLP